MSRFFCRRGPRSLPQKINTPTIRAAESDLKAVTKAGVIVRPGAVICPRVARVRIGRVALDPIDRLAVLANSVTREDVAAGTADRSGVATAIANVVRHRHR